VKSVFIRKIEDGVELILVEIDIFLNHLNSAEVCMVNVNEEIYCLEGYTLFSPFIHQEYFAFNAYCRFSADGGPSYVALELFLDFL